MSSKPTLGYWKIRGLAQPIRLVLAYAGGEWEDKQYVLAPDVPWPNCPEWLADKGASSAARGNCP